MSAKTWLIKDTHGDFFRERGEGIRNWRAVNGYSLADVGEMCGVSGEAVRNWESGCLIKRIYLDRLVVAGVPQKIIFGEELDFLLVIGADDIC